MQKEEEGPIPPLRDFAGSQRGSQHGSPRDSVARLAGGVREARQSSQAAASVERWACSAMLR
jgi:hypothetical protein